MVQIGFRILIAALTCAGLMLGEPAFAAKSPKSAHLSLVSRVQSITDIKVSENQSAPTPFGTTYEAELGLRLRSFFQWIFLGYRSADSTRTGYGTGFRIDLPGVFWIGNDQSRKSQRNWPVNTSIFGAILSSTLKEEGSPSARAFDTTIGIGIDVYLFNRFVFLTGQAALISSQGNGFSSFGGGLGIEL